MSQVAARQPRQVKALHLHDEPSYIQQFRQELLTRGLATNTRNAYIRDLMLCETTCSKAITRWDASDVLALTWRGWRAATWDINDLKSQDKGSFF